MAFPTSVKYGQVSGRFLQAVADGVDLDRNPDGIPAVGQVIFEARPVRIRHDVNGSDPVSILPRPIVCDIDAEGYLVDEQGARGVFLIATDDPDSNPVDWTWTVTFAFEGILVPAFPFQVPAGSTVDLTNVTPAATPEPGTQIIQGPKGDQGIQGPKGDTGNVGPANELTIGTVEGGELASANITGTSPAQTLSLVLPG